MGVGCLAVRRCGDDVGAAQPVRLGEVGGGPLRRMIGMGVVEAADFRSSSRASCMIRMRSARSRFDSG